MAAEGGEMQDEGFPEAANTNELAADGTGRPPRSRGGRGRRRWRDRDERGEPMPAEGVAMENASADVARQEEPVARYEQPAPAPRTDGNTLPAFATEDRPLIELATNRPAPQPVVASPMVESTPRNPDAPVKKGWWQKMIELDD
jgi:hypothetical protein